MKRPHHHRENLHGHDPCFLDQSAHSLAHVEAGCIYGNDI